MCIRVFGRVVWDHGYGGNSFKMRQLAASLMQVDLNNGKSTMLWWDNWTGIQQVTGDHFILVLTSKHMLQMMYKMKDGIYVELGGKFTE